MKFTLPETLPTVAAELSDLLTAATKELNVLQAKYAAEHDLSADEAAYATQLAADIKTIKAAIADGEAHAANVAAAMGAADEALAEEGSDEDESDDDSTDETLGKADDTADEGDQPEGGTGAPADFAGGGNIDKPEDTDDSVESRWEMALGAPGYKQGKVGFKELAEGIDNMPSGSRRTMRSNRNDVSVGYAAQSVATLRRFDEFIETPQEMLKALDNIAKSLVVPAGLTPAQALTAAGGWCAPSEQIYTFCDVPDATDLISLPEIPIRRGGIRWPVEPDLTPIFADFEFFFTEPQLEATDGDGNPTAFKHCVEIPCPDEFEEIRLNAVGYCIEAGILQRQGWPESIEWFLRNVVQEHLRAMSRRTILNMVAGSTLKTFADTVQVGATSGVLNALRLIATNIRLHRGLARNALIEGVAPSWIFEAIRADLAMYEGTETKYVSDSTINGWINASNISLQLVGDWQTRDANTPGHLDTMRWPGHVDILMYPAGTWFRSVSNIIEVGLMYPKEQLQVNRYTHTFTEDSIAVGKRCGVSLVARIPLKINGGFGASVALTYSDTTHSSGTPIQHTPIESGDVPAQTRTLTIGGSPTSFSLNLVFDGKKTATTVTQTTTAAQLQDKLVALADGYGESDFTVTGSAGGPFTITTPAGSLAVADFTPVGGSSPTATIA